MLLLLHREVWPINAHYWHDTQYAPRVLHFSAFHYVGNVNLYIWACTVKRGYNSEFWFLQTLGANTICVRDWSCADEKLANTTTATGAMRYIATYPGKTVLKQASGTWSSIYSNAGLREVPFYTIPICLLFKICRIFYLFVVVCVCPSVRLSISR